MTKKLRCQIRECPAAAALIRACQIFAEGKGSQNLGEAYFLVASLLDYVKQLISFSMDCKRR